MSSMSHITDSYHIDIFARKNRYGDYFVELFTLLDVGDGAPLRFLAIPHRGYPTAFNPSLAGQANTAVAAIAMCRRKVRHLTQEEIQATPEGIWVKVA
jgi:hypothetical protein